MAAAANAAASVAAAQSRQGRAGQQRGQLALTARSRCRSGSPIHRVAESQSPVRQRARRWDAGRALQAQRGSVGGTARQKSGWLSSSSQPGGPPGSPRKPHRRRPAYMHAPTRDRGGQVGEHQACRALGHLRRLRRRCPRRRGGRCCRCRRHDAHLPLQALGLLRRLPGKVLFCLAHLDHHRLPHQHLRMVWKRGAGGPARGIRRWRAVSAGGAACCCHLAANPAPSAACSCAQRQAAATHCMSSSPSPTTSPTSKPCPPSHAPARSATAPR